MKAEQKENKGQQSPAAPNTVNIKPEVNVIHWFLWH